MSSNPQSLGQLIENACLASGIAIDPEKRPYNHNNKNAGDTPMLRPSGRSRILVYPGCFNPPHHGHLDVITHAYNNAGEDVHIVAAIIRPTDESKLEAKAVEDGDTNPLILSREKRAQLWQSAESILDWAWVFPGRECDWRPFRESLTQNFDTPDRDLKFMLLLGPDWVTANRVFNPQALGCFEAITTDASRTAEFRYPNSLRQLAGSLPWERPVCDVNRIERHVRARMRGKPAQDVDEAITTAIAKVRAVWICHSLGPKRFRFTIRFLPCDLDARPPVAPSSSMIQEIVSKTGDADDEDELAKKLDGIALGPALLASFVKEMAN